MAAPTAGGLHLPQGGELRRAGAQVGEQPEQSRVTGVAGGRARLVAATRDLDRIESQVPALVCTSSKAALDVVTHQYAQLLDGVRVVSLDPGCTATDLNGHSGPQMVTEGTDAVVEACTADELPGVSFSQSGAEAW